MNEFPRNWIHFIKNALAALVAGGRIVPLGDNGAVLRELADRPTARRAVC